MSRKEWREEKERERERERENDRRLTQIQASVIRARFAYSRMCYMRKEKKGKIDQV